LTVLIGANNLCRGCDPNFNIYDEAKDFEDQLRALVAQLQEVPRLFVNMVSIFNISQVFKVSEKELYCRGVHDILGFLEVRYLLTLFHRTTQANSIPSSLQCECVFPFKGGDALVRFLRALI